MRIAVCLFAIAVLGTGVAPAEAQSGHIHGLRPEVHTGIGFHGFLSGGFDLEIPIVPDGFLRSMDDELAIAAGFDLLFLDFAQDPDDPRGVGFAPNVTAQWNFYLNDRWSVFPEAGFALLFLTENSRRYYRRHGRDRGVYVLSLIHI